MIIRQWCESCGCVTPPAPCGGCQYCKERDAERAVIAAAEAWRDYDLAHIHRYGYSVEMAKKSEELTLAIDNLRRVREGK